MMRKASLSPQFKLRNCSKERRAETFTANGKECSHFMTLFDCFGPLLELPKYGYGFETVWKQNEVKTRFVLRQ